MNTRYILTAFLAVILTAVSANALQIAEQPGVSGKATVKLQDSDLNWRASKVLGKHNGTVAFRNGTLAFEDGALTGGRFEVDMRTIKNLDIDDDKTRAKLVGHLKSDDFFSADKHPMAEFTITRVAPVRGAKTGEPNYNITGNMKIKGISKQITFPAAVHMHDGTVHATATLTLDRTRWDIKYGSGSFFDDLGDNMIHDEFHLDLDVKATM